MKNPGLIRAFFRMESASGMLLLLAAATALIVANSGAAHGFETVFEARYRFTVFGEDLAVSLRSLVNEGLMTLFFLLIGLELKHEWSEGRLVLSQKLLLPAATAGAGMLVPALVYLAVSAHHGDLLRGWAVPVATDIAFSLGILSLFGKRIPMGLLYFLMLLAILDDAGAVVVIALFYSRQMTWLPLVWTASVMGGLLILCRIRVMAVWPWMVGGGLLWFSVWSMGIHPVLAGVLLAMVLPAGGKGNPVLRLMRALHPWVAFGIMPLFALANAGVSLQGGLPSGEGLLVPAIALGLFVGKPLGVFGMAFLLVRFRLARLPEGVDWKMFAGVAFLCGIGFTMSLFIGTLAFEYHHPLHVVAVRQGVLLGSCLSGMVGGLLLWTVCRTGKPRKRGIQ